MSHDHAADGTFEPVTGSAIAGFAQLVCDWDSIAADRYIRTCPTCEGRLSFPLPITGVDLSISFLSHKGRMSCPTCEGFGSVDCNFTGELIS